jgi:integrase
VSHLEREIARFEAHMRDAGGLALNTRQQRCGIVARFLAGLFQTGPILIPAIEPTAIRQFVLGNGAEWSAGTVRVIGGAVGGYLRFRALAGDRVTELLAAIPRAAHWRLAALPEVLSDAEIEELLRSFDPPFRSHRRAFAMLRCLTDLGLRCSEVANLRLEDINWNGDRPECGGRTKPVSHRNSDHPAFSVLHPVGPPRLMASRPPRFWTVSLSTAKKQGWNMLQTLTANPNCLIADLQMG